MEELRRMLMQIYIWLDGIEHPEVNEIKADIKKVLDETGPKE